MHPLDGLDCTVLESEYIVTYIEVKSLKLGDEHLAVGVRDTYRGEESMFHICRRLTFVFLS